MGGVGRVGLLLGGGSLAEQHLQRPTAPRAAHTEAGSRPSPREQSSVSAGVLPGVGGSVLATGPRGIAAGHGTEKPHMGL